MLISRWIIAAALGLAVTSLQAQEQAETSQATEKERGQQTDTFSPSIPVRIIESEESSRSREGRERESDQREEDDLIAQQRMADATEAMNDATQSMNRAAWVSAFFVALGTGLLVWTLWLTRQANRSAQAAVRVAKETGRDQMRAYVDVGDVTFYWGSESRDKPSFHLALVNHGQTPAKWFEVRQGFLVFEHAKESPVPPSFDDFALPEKFGDRWHGLSPGGPDGKTTSGPKIIHPDILKECWRREPGAWGIPPDNTHGIIVYGEIRYCTIFDEIYRSQFIFGAGTLEAYKVDEIIKGRNIIVDGVMGPHETYFEKPQSLTRLSIEDLALYKPEKT